MQTKLLLVAVAVAAVLFAGWWWFVETPSHVPAPARSDPAVAAAAAVPADAEVAAATAEHPEQDAEAGLDRTEVGARPAAADGAPRFVVRGRIVDLAGAPREGVVITPSTWPAEMLDTAAPPAPRIDIVNAPTAADGRFTLRIPTGLDGHLLVRDADQEFLGPRPEFHSSKGDQDLGDLVVVAASVLEGVVQDEHGRPVADVGVEAGQGSFAFATRSTARTAADGTFRIGKLRPGKWLLRTASSQFLPATLEVELEPEQKRTDLVVVVKKGDAIAGRVVDDRGAGVAGVKVACKRRELHGAMDVERFSSSEAATTDAAGYFTLAGLPRGTVTIRTFGKGVTGTTMSDVAVGTGDLVLRVQRLATIEGTLTAADGRPIAGWEVRAERPRRPVAFEGGFTFGSAVTDADGRFVVPDVEPGTVTVRATGRGHRPAVATGLEVLPGQRLEGVHLVADPGAVARVLVVDDGGGPVAGARVVAKAPARGSSPVRMVASAIEEDGGPRHVYFGDEEIFDSAETGADGTAVLLGLPAQEVQFVATHERFASAAPVVEAVAHGGTADVRLVLREPGFVAVHVVDSDGKPLPGAALRVEAVGEAERMPWDQAQDDRRRDATSDGEGNARVGPFVPGSYKAVLTKSPVSQDAGGAVIVFPGSDTLSSSAVTVHVEAGKTVAVELRRPVMARLFGTVTGAEGPLSGGEVALASRGDRTFGMPGLGERKASIGADGSYVFEDVEAGAYTLVFGRSRQIVKARTDVDVLPGASEQRQDLELRVGRLVARVHDAVSGDAIEGADVEIERGEGEDSGGGPGMRASVMFSTRIEDGEDGGELATMTMGVHRVRTDATGQAVVDDLPAGTYTIRVNHAGHAPGEWNDQVVVERRTTDCGRIDLVPGGRVRCTIRGADGNAPPIAFVQSRRVDSQAWSQPQPAPNGACRLDALPPGRYAVRAFLPGSNARGDEVEVTVEAGATVDAELRTP